MIELIEFVENAETEEEEGDTLTLPYDQRQKRRQRVRLDSGREAAILLSRGCSLVEGDCLRSSDGFHVRVRAAAESVSSVRSEDPLRVARACYHLGNRHVSLQVGAGWLRYQPDHVLDDMLRGLGLTVIHEMASFEPERGAYHEHNHRHRHRHSHDIQSDHSHPSDHGYANESSHEVSIGESLAQDGNPT